MFAKFDHWKMKIQLDILKTFSGCKMYCFIEDIIKTRNTLTMKTIHIQGIECKEKYIKKF
jgi:hypothetical protein